MRHPVYDTDAHFSLDTDTRALISNMRKVSLIQGDHNSERFTFDLPAEIEGHKLVDCDKIEVHFINIDMVTQAPSKGFYTVDKENDLMVHPDDPTKVVFSWLIDGRATKYVGSLSFVIRVTCLNGSAVIYAWHTAVFSGISVLDGICNTEEFVEEYSDTVEAWRLEIEAGLRELEDGLKVLENNRITNMRQTKAGTSDGGLNEWELTLGDGRTLTLQIKNGSRGPAGPTGQVGSVVTVNGKTLNFFIGTQAEFDALTLVQRVNLLSVITDDPNYTSLLEAATYISGVKEGTTKVKAAETADKLSAPMYLATVKAVGKNASDEAIVFYFSFITSKKAGSKTAQAIKDILPSYEIPASGFCGASQKVYAVRQHPNSNGIQFLIGKDSSETWYHCITSINPGYSLEFTINYTTLTGGN